MRGLTIRRCTRTSGQPTDLHAIHKAFRNDNPWRVLHGQRVVVAAKTHQRQRVRGYRDLAAGFKGCRWQWPEGGLVCLQQFSLCRILPPQCLLHTPLPAEIGWTARPSRPYHVRMESEQPLLPNGQSLIADGESDALFRRSANEAAVLFRRAGQRQMQPVILA